MWSTKEHCLSLKIPGTVRGHSEGFLVNHSPGRDLVILLHATGNDMHYPWSQIIRELVSHDFQVLVFDLPGHGIHSTDILTDNAYSCVEKALEEAGKVTHWNKIFGIGQSLGGALLLQAASHSNTSFAKLSIWGLPDGNMISLASLSELVFLLMPSFWRLSADYGWRNIFPAFMSFKRQHFPVRVRGKNYILEVLALLKAISVSFDAEKAPPTQFLVGSLDFIASRNYAVKLSQLIEGSRCEQVFECHFSTMFSQEAITKTLSWFQT